MNSISSRLREIAVGMRNNREFPAQAIIDAQAPLRALADELDQKATEIVEAYGFGPRFQREIPALAASIGDIDG